MDPPDNIFERVAEKLEEERKKAFKGLPSSSKYLSLSDSTNTKEIGSQFPQTDRIDLNKAHSIKYHQLNGKDLVFDRIDLYKSAKLTDNISTAAVSASAFLLSKKALDVFLNFDLGNYKIYPAFVYHQGIKNEYGVLHFVNDFKDEINYKKSEFYISTILGSYQEDIEINSQEDYKKKWHLVNSGEYQNTEEFWSIKLKLGIIDKKVHVPDIFTILPSSEGIYISRNLAQAIVDSNLTGFEFNRIYGIKD